MLYFSFSNVKEDAWQGAGDDILQKLSSEGFYSQILANDKTWEEALRSHPSTTQAFKKIEDAKIKAANQDNPDHNQINNLYKADLKAFTTQVLGSHFPEMDKPLEVERLPF